MKKPRPPEELYNEGWENTLALDKTEAMQDNPDLTKKERAYWAKKKIALDHAITPGSKAAVIERNRAIWNAARAAIEAGSMTWADVHQQLTQQGVYQRLNKKSGKWYALSPLEGWRILRRIFNLPAGKPGRPAKSK